MSEKLTRGVFYVEKEEKKNENVRDEEVTGMNFELLKNLCINLKTGEVEHLEDEEFESESSQNKENMNETGNETVNKTEETIKEVAQKKIRFGMPPIPPQYQAPEIVDKLSKKTEGENRQTIQKMEQDNVNPPCYQNSDTRVKSPENTMRLYDSEIRRGFESICKQIESTQDVTSNAIEHLERKISVVNRKEKRRELSTEMVVLSDLNVYAATFFDDGIHHLELFFMNVRGPFEIANIALEENPTNSNWVIVFFDNGSKHILIERIHFTKNKLWEAFEQAGVRFSKKISAPHAKELVYGYFAPKFIDCEKVLELSGRAGWKNKVFIHAANFPFKKVPILMTKPVMQKAFGNERALPEDWEIYCEELSGILEEKNRLTILIYPYAAMIASIMNNEGIPLKININIVEMAGLSLETICMWLQVFNKKNPVLIDAAESTKSLIGKMADTKDETFLLNCLPIKGSNQYYISVKNNHKELVLNLIEENAGIQGVQCIPNTFGVVSVSDSVRFSKNTVNLFMTEENLSERLLKSRNLKKLTSVFTRVFFTYVEFITCEYDQIVNELVKKRESENEILMFFEMMLSIISRFEQFIGIKILNKAGFLNTVDVSGMVFESACEDYLENFVRAVRKYISTISIVHRNIACSNQEVIFFDDECLYIPVTQYKKIINLGGMKNYENHILLKLKEKGDLIPASDRLAYRLMHEGTKTAVYKIKKSALNECGEIDVLDLAKDIVQGGE